jgi:CYTH domain-containing protein
MNIEIERKFLVTGEFKHLAYAHSHIQQGYFDTAPGRTVRVRIRDDKAYLTIKAQPCRRPRPLRFETK